MAGHFLYGVYGFPYVYGISYFLWRQCYAAGIQPFEQYVFYIVRHPVLQYIYRNGKHPDISLYLERKVIHFLPVEFCQKLHAL